MQTTYVKTISCSTLVHDSDLQSHTLNALCMISTVRNFILILCLRFSFIKDLNSLRIIFQFSTTSIELLYTYLCLVISLLNINIFNYTQLIYFTCHAFYVLMLKYATGIASF